MNSAIRKWKLCSLRSTAGTRILGVKHLPNPVARMGLCLVSIEMPILITGRK